MVDYQLPPDAVTLARYLSGEMSAMEAARVEQWIDAEPAHQEMIASLQTAWNRPDVRAVDPDDVLWRNIREQLTPAYQAPALIRTPPKPAIVTPITRRTPARWAMAVSTAAVVVFALGIGGTMLWHRSSTRGESGVEVSSTGGREIATRRGERAALRLVDGTRVVLAPQSRLRIPAGYYTRTGLGARDIELDGEAFFEVRHDTARPFRVRTAAGIAEDLGTEFVVTAYPGTRGMRVVVASGEVAIHGPKMRGAAADTAEVRPLVVLRRGELAQLDTTGAVNVRQRVDTRRYTAWTTGRLVFADTPTGEALATLSRWYDLDFRLGDPSRSSHPVSVSFDGETTAQDVIKLFELLLRARAEREGRIVTFHARASDPGAAAIPHRNTGAQ